MITDLKSIKLIEDIPFGGIMRDADPQPALGFRPNLVIEL